MPRDVIRLRHEAHMSADTPDTGELMLYGEIIRNMPESWKWDDADKSAVDFDKAVKQLRKDGAKKLLLRINSPGGTVNESIAMRSILMNAGFDAINIRIEGWCASAATNIATIPGAHVSIVPGSEYMIHNPWNSVIGFAEDMEREAAHLRNIEASTRKMYADRTGQDEDQIKTWMDAETWFSAEDAVKYGFCDEMMETPKENGTKMRAMSQPMMSAVRSMYHHAPDEIPEMQVEEPAHIESNATPEAGEASLNTNTPKEEKKMELTELTMEQLQSGNAELFASIQKQAIEAERERIADIDALTLSGYEEMAENAKKNGTSVMDFQKQIVAAQKQKGKDFLQARAVETAPAKKIAGGEPVDNVDEEAEIKAQAKSVAKYAEQMRGNYNGMF